MPTNTPPTPDSITYDDRSQYEHAAAYLLPGEALEAVYSCKGMAIRFVAFTDRRLIFYDQGILIRKKTMVSIPYHHVTGIACVDEGVIFAGGEITLLINSGKVTFEFRDASAAQKAYYCLASHMIAQPVVEAQQ